MATKKTLLHRWFGWGKIPKKYAPTLQSEGIVLLEEGIGGTVTFRKFKAPGRYHSYKKSWFTGCLVITEKTFAAFALIRPIIFVPLDHEKFSELKCKVEEGKTLYVNFDASAFNEKWSGTIECRFTTSKARQFLRRLK